MSIIRTLCYSVVELCCKNIDLFQTIFYPIASLFYRGTYSS